MALKKREFYLSLGQIGIPQARAIAAHYSLITNQLFSALADYTMNENEKELIIAKTLLELKNEELVEKLASSNKNAIQAHANAQKQILRAESKASEASDREFEAHQQRVRAVRELEEKHAKELEAMKEAAKLATEAAIKAIAKPEGILLSALIETRLKGLSDKTTDKQHGVYRSQYAEILEVLGDRPITSFTHADAVKFSDAIKALPKNRFKGRYKGESIESILSLDIPTTDKQSSTTINNKIARARALFQYAIETGQLENSPFADKGLIAIGQPTPRLPFTEEDLCKLFSGKIFTKSNFQNSYSYWLMPMALLTGARLNELCQLDLADFVKLSAKEPHSDQPETIDCIYINGEYDLRGKVVTEGTKKVKNKSSIRHIPIHPYLIELGLLEHIEKLRAAGETRLFPELKFGRDGYGKQPSRWFGSYSAACGIDAIEKVFHSFRHTFVTNLLEMGFSEEQIAPITGHEGKLVTKRVYGATAFPLINLHKIVTGISIPDAIKHLIPKYKDVSIKNEKSL
ncbi:tyrosine-type recombinase/integrase [Chitinibacter sp. SCUT-21]